MIRKAEVADLQRMQAAAEEFYASSRFLRGFDIAHFTAAWTGLLESGTGVIFLALEQDEVIGAIGGVRYPDLNSGELVATEFFWFVREGHRGPGLRLYREFEAWARERGCTRIRMVHLMDSMPEQLMRTYGRLGFVPVEVNYEKELI